MKKRIFLFLLLFTSISAMPLMAQSDGFFNYSSSDSETRAGNAQNLDGYVHTDNFVNEEVGDAPLGSGLLVLLASGMAYAALKRKENKI